MEATIISAIIGAIGRIAPAILNFFGKKKEGKKERVEKKPEKEPPPKLEKPILPQGMPALPNAYFAHPYPMQKNFTGRETERKELTEWFTNASDPMFAYVAMGGMGKSALTWYWLQEDIIKQGLAPEGIIWWSFYDKEARFETFLMKAIQYASKGEVDLQKMPSTRDRMDALYTLLYHKKFLLVLDGVERVLRTYAGLGSPYQGDEVKKDEKKDYRKCVDPNVGNFLQWLTSNNLKTKTQLTSRLCPEELDDIAGSLCKDLTKMDKKDAVEFLWRQGVKGTRAEIEKVCDFYGYHPLSLRLLSGMIVKDPKFKGDIVGWTRHNPIPELTGTQRQHHILNLSYDSLDSSKQSLISKLSAFRHPMTYDAISIFNHFGNEKEFDEALIELKDRGLLLLDDKTKRHDLHPIVRSYCYDRLLDKKGVHSQLRDYFAKVPEPEKVEPLDDLGPVIELYHHTVNSGGFDEARQLYRDRLGPLYFQFCAYNLIIDLLRVLFPDGEDKPPRLKEQAAQGWTMNELANSYTLSGQLKKAVPLFEMSNQIDEKRGNQKGFAIGLNNLACQQITLAELESGESNLRRVINLCQEIENKFDKAVGHQELGRLLAYRGRFEESERELTKAQRVFDEYGHAHTNFVSVVRAYLSLVALFIDNPSKALEFAEKALELAKKSQKAKCPYAGPHDIIRAEWLLGAAYLGKGDLKEAEKHLDEALKRDRRINLVELEPDILLELAKLRFKKGNRDEALKLAKEALQIADRSEYRLKQADINNFLAEFYLDKKDFPKAKEHADIAKERAECGYKPALDKAEKLAILIKEKSGQ